MSPIRLALVGFGKIAHDQHLPAIAASPAFELVCGVSVHGRSPAGATYRDVDSMLAAEPGVQAVAMCQPPQARFEATRAALLAGKHVLLEKPPGATVGEVLLLADIARERGLTMFCTWHSRFAAAVEPARAWLQGRRIRSVAITWREDVRVWHPGQAWLWEAGGMGVFDPGINALSIATRILPPLRLIDGSLCFPSNRQAPIAAELSLATLDGGPVTADFDMRQTGPQTWDIRIDTDGGELLLREGGGRLCVDGVDQPLPPSAEYPSLYARFADLISASESDADVRPLGLVADAFLRARREIVEPFEA